MPHPAFHRLEHRPWPCPNRPWFARQTWCDLLFAHWPVPSARLRPLVPEGLDIQEFEGSSWVGVVPFRMEGVAPRFSPNIPGFSVFPEVNLRLYVQAGGKPGVWFLSLDATNALAVWGARRFFHLPYFNASISLAETPEGIVCDSARSPAYAPAQLQANYAPTGEVYEAVPGSLEHWLTERYCLYAETPAGQLMRTQVHHRPWPLQPAEAEIAKNSLADGHGFELPGEPALVHFSRRLEVVAWTPRPARA